METQCPKCQAENPTDSKFCKECAYPLLSSDDIPASVTKTLETPFEKLASGSILGNRYEIIEELGKGGMGRVYKVHDKEIKEQVALKLLKPEIAADENTIERFRNELKIARKVSQKNVCRMHDIGRADDKYFITMEYVEGEDLKGHINKKERLSPDEAIGIAKQICDGLVEAHRLGVVHRDLKPQNIMIDKQGDAKIMDFGIARSLEAPGVTATGVIIGTPDYISPEQAEGIEADHRSDIYSLGVILYEMVTGSVPFKGDTAFSVALKHKSQMPLHPQKLNPDVPDNMARLILICMEKDRDRRYQTANALLSDLKNIEEGFPLGTKVQPRRATFFSVLKRKKIFIPALIAKIAILAILFWRFFPKKEIPYVAKYENSIAVLGFENKTGDSSFDMYQKFIPNLLVTTFEEAKFSYVATWEHLQDMLKQTGKDDPDLLDRDLGFEICRRDGIQYVVIGSFSKGGNTFVTELQILDVGTRSSVAGTNSQGEGAQSFFDKQIDELSLDIIQKIGSTEQKLEKGKMAVAEVTTSSPEAYDYYLKGKAKGGDHLGAKQYLEKAVDIDPTFASAFRLLSVAYFNLRDYKSRDDAIKKAKAFADRASEKEKLWIQFNYVYYIENARMKERFPILEELAKKFPKEKGVHFQLGEAYNLYFRDFEKAIEEYNKELEINPNHGSSVNRLAGINRDLENYERAIELHEQYAAMSPTSANPYDSMANTYYRMGKLDDALLNFRKAVEKNPDFHQPYWEISYIYALKENYAEALSWIEKLKNRFDEPGLKRSAYSWRGFYYLWLGRYDIALQDFDGARELADLTGDENSLLFLDAIIGNTHFEKGDFEHAKDYFGYWYDALFPKNQQEQNFLTIMIWV